MIKKCAFDLSEEIICVNLCHLWLRFILFC